MQLTRLCTHSLAVRISLHVKEWRYQGQQEVVYMHDNAKLVPLHLHAALMRLSGFNKCNALQKHLAERLAEIMLSLQPQVKTPIPSPPPSSPLYIPRCRQVSIDACRHCMHQRLGI